MKVKTSKKIDLITFLLLMLFLSSNIVICQQTCPEDKPIYKTSTGQCVLEGCTEKDFSKGTCVITNHVIKNQLLGEFLYASEPGSPIYSSFGRNSDGDIYFESSLGTPYSQKKIFSFKSDGREYIDGIRRNVINLDSNLYSTNGVGAIVKINGHKCYLKLSNSEAIEMYDFDDKKYTSAKFEDIFGNKVQSVKNTLINTKVENTFVYAYITTGNYLIMQKFKVVSNEASNCIQLIKTLKENVKTIPKDSRRCMNTTSQYIECLDMDENQNYVVRVYDSDLKFIKEFPIEKNNAPAEKAIYTYHEIVWLKNEISILIYYTDTSDNNAKPILVLKTLSTKGTSLNNLNNYLKRDIVYGNLPYKFSDTENSLAIFNDYYFGLSSFTETTENSNRHLIVTLFNIFNDDKTIDTHYFDIPIKDLYNIEYQNGLQAFGYKNAYGVQMNYIQSGEHRSGFIVFGYANTTDPEPINRLFDQYSSYTIKIRDFYKGIENNIFCYVFVRIEATQVPSSSYFTVKTSKGKTVSVGTTLTLDDEIIITKKYSSTNIPKGRYVLGLAPYLNENDYDGFVECSADVEMFGEVVPTEWYPDEYYGRTIEFKFTAGIDCFENCETCTNKGLSLDDQKCDTCKNGFYFVENTKNCFGEPPDGYYFNRDKKVYSKCYDSCKACSTIKEGNIHNCLICKENYLFYRHTNCLDCKYRNKYVNYEQTDCIDSIPNRFYCNNTEYNTIDKCHEHCLTCSGISSNDDDMKCLTCDNANGFYLIENTNNCRQLPYPGYYLDGSILRKCHHSCSTCSARPIVNDYGEVTNCDTCNNAFKFYPIENTQTCVNRTRDGIYFDLECGCYKKCYKDCLTCSGREIDQYHMNCLTCDIINGFQFFKYTTNCLKCKSLSKYVNYEQTECIDNIPNGFYVNDTEYNTIDKCYEHCLTCSGKSSNDEDMKCLACDNDNGFYLVENTNNCKQNPYPGHYLDGNILRKCHYSCTSCSARSIFNDYGEVTNCDTCNNAFKFYPIENTQTCVNRTRDGIYFDLECGCYKKCYKDCLTCSGREIDQYHMNCLTCDIINGFQFFKYTTNCLKCKSLSKYVNYEQTECIDNVPNGFYVNDTEYNTIDKCHKNCLTCNQGSSNEDDMKCLSCDNTNRFYFVENTNNCHQDPYPGYYLNESEKVLKKCYKDCLTCTGKEIINGKGKITNMNCITCDESKGFYLIPGTNNCEDRNKIYEDTCPEDRPILKDGKCVLDYCTEEEYQKKICNVSSVIIKKQWIDYFPYIRHPEVPIYSTLGKNKEGDIFFESNLGGPLTERNIYTLKENGRGYIEGIPAHIIDLNSNLFSKDGNGAIVKINGNKCYLKLSYDESIELYDFVEEKYTSAKLEDILGYKIISHKNSLLETNEENTFIYAYITTGNYLMMQKFKLVTNEASNCIQLIKTLKENVKTIPKDSRRCMNTTSQYIECLDMDENQNYVVRIYDSNINFLKEFELDKNNAPSEKAFKTYHEAVWLKDDISVFIYFTDTSENKAKPILALRKLTVNNGQVNLETLNSYLTKNVVFKNIPYTFSDSENSLAIFNDYYFALSSITESNNYVNKHLIISLFNIFNEDQTIHTHYFDVPLKDLYDLDYYSGLQAFGYKNGYGVQFNHKKDNEYRTGFIIFGYGNTTDPQPKNNLFENQDSFTFKPSDYIRIENNVFCYVLINVIITDLPNASTGIKVVKASNSVQLKVGDVLSLNDEIKITYSGNKDEIPRGKYKVGFTPYLNEAEYDDYYECAADVDMFGEQVPTIWTPDEYYGRTAYFEFTINDCFTNCKSCIVKGLTLNDQKCKSCLNGFYFVENTENCFEEPPEGYYFNEEKEVHSKCYDKCKTCSKLNSGNIHNCLSCYINYLLYNSTNCLDCKYNNRYVNYKQTECIDSVPDGFYVNNTEYNTIDKCYSHCGTCNKGPSGNNMNCLTCANGFYFVENTNNCEQDPYPGHYLDEDILKKCYKYCLTCSGKPVANNKGVITNMNCDKCDESKGYFLIPGTKNCEDKNIVYDDDNCPVERPISKNGNCVLDYCTKEEYKNKKCNVSNVIIKEQWIEDFPYVSELDKPLYSTLGQLSNEEINFESNLGNPFTDRKIFTLNDNGRGYIDGVPGQIIDLNSSYFSTYGNGALIKLNGHKCYLRLSYYETIEMYDFDNKKYTSAKLEDILGYKIESHKNSLLRTNEENTFIFAYITRGNYLIMQKFKIITNDAKDCIKLLKTSLESVKTISKDSRRCMITEKQYIECIDMDENQMYVIRLYDKDLNYLKQYGLEKNKAPSDRAFYTYHETIWIKEEVSIFVYFNDISDNNAKPIIVLKKLVQKAGDVELEDLSTFLDKEKLYNSLPYIISDSENSIAKINDYYFALASITSYDSRHMLIIVFNILNEDNTLYANYFDVPIKQLYDIDYYRNLQSFGYKNAFGVQFDHKKGKEYRSGFIIFGYGNTTDPTPIHNLFTNYESYTFKPYDYIKIENNVFCYILVNIVITDIPDPSSGIKVLKASNSAQLHVGDVLSMYDEIKITYSGNKDDIPRGKYTIGFKPYVNEPEQDRYYECISDLEVFGEIIPTYWAPDEYYGRTAHFTFTAGECFQNCKTCINKGSSLDNQKCESCLENYYFVEGTQNCFEHPPEGYYFNEEKEVHSKCYNKCKTCTKKNSEKIHNCLSCYTNNLLYNSTNCLDCKYNKRYVNYEQTECIDSIPDGFYCNNSEYNTIDKCHENCKTCSKPPSQDGNMNCLSCDNDKGFYLVENTNNCEQNPYPGHYLEEDILKKCHISCATCSAKPIFNDKGEVINCDKCNKDLGFYPVEGSKVCRNKTKEGEYFDEECGCYKKCYKDCLTCSGKEIDQYHMNCLNCDKSKGYTYFMKTTNCLNCKSQSKYANYEQTECIDKVPSGYFVNDTEINTLDKCYQDCYTCSKAGTSELMNCITCQPSLYLKNGNCVKTYTCPYKFFYQIKIDKNADINQKICLDENEVCPCALPFYYTLTNECVEECPLELLLYQGCKISNLPYGLNKIILIVKLTFSQGLIDTLTKSFTLSDINYYYSLAVKLSVYSLFSSYNLFRQLEMTNNTYQNLNNDDLTSLNEQKYFNGSEIDLGPCEKKLREYYNIPNDVQLTIIKLDFKKNDSTVNNVQYEVFNPKNRKERLDLSICNEEKVILKNPIDSSLSLNRISYIMDSSDQSYDILSENNAFYKDECYIFTSEDGADVLLQDRLIEYNYNNKICQKGCELQKINITNEEAFCLCQPNTGFVNVSNIEEIMNEDNNVINDITSNNTDNSLTYQKYSAVNAKILKCAKNIGVDFFKNYIIIIFTLLLIGYIVISVIYFINPLFGSNMKEERKENKPKVKNLNNKNKDDIQEKVRDLDPAHNSKEEFKRESRESSQKNDPDLFDYETALKKDAEISFISMFISSIRKRLIIFNCIKDKNTIFLLQIILLVFTIINYIIVNGFFFTEKNIHQIYLDKGKYNFNYQIKYIILASLISSIFLYLARFLINIRKENREDKEKSGSFDKRILAFIFVSNSLFIFYWVYLGSLTSTYINAKNHLVINSIITFLFCCILDSFLSLISVILRKISIKRKISRLYSISQFINLH